LLKTSTLLLFGYNIIINYVEDYELATFVEELRQHFYLYWDSTSIKTLGISESCNTFCEQNE